MVEPQPDNWPEQPGLDTWLPVRAVDGFARELAAVLPEDLTEAWFRMTGDDWNASMNGEIRLIWISNGAVHVAAVRGDWSPDRSELQVIEHGSISLNQLEVGILRRSHRNTAARPPQSSTAGGPGTW